MKPEENPYTDADKKVARIVETVEAEIAECRKNIEDDTTAVPVPEEDDCVVYGPNTRTADDQWGEQKGGDALILSNPIRFKVHPPEKKPEREYGPEDDDSIVYPVPGEEKAEKPAAPETSASQTRGIWERSFPRRIDHSNSSKIWPTATGRCLSACIRTTRNAASRPSAR